MLVNLEDDEMKMIIALIEIRTDNLNKELKERTFDKDISDLVQVSIERGEKLSAYLSSKLTKEVQNG
jgi:hypothetical protein